MRLEGGWRMCWWGDGRRLKMVGRGEVMMRGGDVGGAVMWCGDEGDGSDGLLVEHWLGDDGMAVDWEMMGYIVGLWEGWL